METNRIGSKIAEARKKMNISQARLAQKLFISSQAVGKWERGESLPDIITFNRLAEILGVDLNYFSKSFAPADSENEPEHENKAEQENTSHEQLKKPSWDMSKLNLTDSDFSGLKNLDEKFSSSNMQGCLFIASEMAGIHLKNNNIDKCDFSESDLSRSHIQNSNLANNQFKACSLKETEFRGCAVSGCNFTGADFTEVTVRSGGMEKNTLTNALWNQTKFIDTYLVDMVFEGPLEDCSFENCTFIRVKFQNATFMNTFFKNNRKLKKVRFENCKADKISYAFLKSAYADLSGLSLIPSRL